MCKTKTARKVIRNIIAISFWIHAFYIFHLIPGFSWNKIPLSVDVVYNLALLGFIFYYSWFSERGWFSVIFDLFYIYAWPFFAGFKILWWLTKSGYGYVKRHTVRAPVGLIVQSIQTNEDSQSKPSLKEAIAEIKEVHKPIPVRGWKFALRPVQRFTLLWAILILSLSWNPLIILSSAIVLYGASRAIYNLWDLLSDTSHWTDKLKNSFTNQVAEKIRQVREWEEASGIEAIIKEINVLKLFESVFSFISCNRVFLDRCTTAFAIAITIPFYVYISFLFASVYVGIAHVEHLQLRWPDAMLESLYMPFAYTDLPHSLLIRSIAGLQGIAITLMGWNIFFRNLNSRLSRIVNVAEELSSYFNEESYRQQLQKVIIVSERIPPKKQVRRASGQKVTNRNHRA